MNNKLLGEGDNENRRHDV